MGLLLGLRSRAAFADDRAACFDAASEGQTLRDEHKLVEARAKFQVCAQATCPMSMRADCAGWLDAVKRALPTVVLSAKDGAGQDVLDVSVTLDGVLVAKSLDGQAFPIDPGPHEFRLAGPNGAIVTRQVLIVEGEKARAVAVTLSPAPAVQAPAPPLADASKSSPYGSLRTAGWIVAGIGVAGIATGGAVFGIGSGDRSACASSGACSTQTALDKYNRGTPLLNASYGLFVGGGIATVAGIVLWVASPRPSTRDAPRAAVMGIRLSPARVSVEGAF
jgi:hypothetical protein